MSVICSYQRIPRKSMALATYSQPSAVQIYLKSAIHLRLADGASKGWASTLVATALVCRSAKSLMLRDEGEPHIDPLAK